MRTILRTARRVVGVEWAVGVLALTACASSGRSGAPPPSGVGGGSCPTSPVSIVVTVDQWGDIVSRLAGVCGRVVTIVASSAADPHDYEPTPADAAAFEDADLVVENGLDYDPWADRAVAALDREPEVVNAGEVVGLRGGDNPHVWYGPDYVYEVADAVTAALTKIEPRGATYFRERNRAWKGAMRPYRSEIERIKKLADGQSYGATEGIFDYMAAALGMRNATPAGYARTAANDTEPAPGDLHEFDEALAHREMSVLFFNTQTEGAIPDLLRDDAEDARVPVVNLTETAPRESDSFERWQVSQLRDLADALGT
jgi:zinc/manganese transport system substrate-binding protein